MDLSSSEVERRLSVLEDVGIALVFLSTGKNFPTLFDYLTSTVFVVPSAFLTYIIRFRLHSKAGISAKQHIFATVSRWVLGRLNDHQLHVLHSRNHDKVVKKLIKR